MRGREYERLDVWEFLRKYNFSSVGNYPSFLGFSVCLFGCVCVSYHNNDIMMVPEVKGRRGGEGWWR